MEAPQSGLSDQSIAILEMIAAGNTYVQILEANPDFSYLDIFGAAREALKLHVGAGTAKRPNDTLAKKRERYPRAYEKWEASEDVDFKNGL